MRIIPWAFTLAVVALPLPLAGCPESAGTPDTEAPALVGLDAPTDPERVPLRGPLTLRFSEALLRESALEPSNVVLVEGAPSSAALSDIAHPPMQRAGAIECERALEPDDVLTLWPTRPLRPNTSYTIVVTSGVRDRAGNRLTGAPALVVFTTAPARVRIVAPEGPAPTNALMVVFGYDREMRDSPGEDDAVLEWPDGRTEWLAWSGPTADPRLRAFRLPSPLAPGDGYRLIVRDDGDEVAFAFAVSHDVPEQPPRIHRPELRAFDGAIDVRVTLDVPGFARLWVGGDPSALAPLGPPSFGREHQLGALGLDNGRRVFARVEAWGLAGVPRLRPTSGQEPMSAVVHPFWRIEISEVVTHPQRDWADRRCDCGLAGCGSPFDAAPGCSPRVGPESEFVELVNRSGETIDLTAWPTPFRLRVADSSPEEVPLHPEHTRLYFTPGSSADAWAPGAYVVVKPTAPINNDARLEVVDPWGSVVDRVALGDGEVPGGRSTGVDDEALSRDGESGRWCKTQATPGIRNAPCAEP